MIPIYIFLFALVLKYYSMNRKNLRNWYKRSMDGFFYLSHDYLIVWRTTMGNERFIITISFFLFALRLEDYSMDIQDLSNLYKRSMIFTLCPVINYWYEQRLGKMMFTIYLCLPYMFSHSHPDWKLIVWMQTI